MCFVGLPILKLKKSILKQHPEYRFYDVGRLGTELCKKDVGKLEAIQFICRKKNTSIDCVMAFGDNGNDGKRQVICWIENHIKKIDNYIEN